MNILEIKNNFVKLLFDEDLKLASFIKIKDLKTYIAQIIHIEATKKGKIAIAKIVFNFTTTIKAYDGSIPSIQADVELLEDNFLTRFLDVKEPLVVGSLNDNENLVVSANLLKEKPVIFAEKTYQYVDVIQNMIRQNEMTNKKSVIIDVTGDFEGNKIVATKDFKMPLNKYSIDYIFDRGFEDVTPENKAFFQDIFSELNDYIKTIEYIPFRTFVEVVDAEYKQSNLLQLIMLRNRLTAFERDGIFAQSKSEFSILNTMLENNQTVIVDISKLNVSLQTEYIDYIYSVIEKYPETFIFVGLNNKNSNNKTLNKILTTNDIHTTIICSYDYQYNNVLKQCSKNMLMFTPIKQQNDFGAYNVYLNKLSEKEYVLYGKSTKFIPIIVNSKISASIEKTIIIPRDVVNVDSVIQPAVAEVEQPLVETQTIEEVEQSQIEPQPIVEEVAEVQMIENIEGDTPESDNVISSMNLQPIVEEIPQEDVIAEVQEIQETSTVNEYDGFAINPPLTPLEEQTVENVDEVEENDVSEPINQEVEEQNNDVMNIVVEPTIDSNLNEMASLVQAELSGISIDIDDADIPTLAKVDNSIYDEYRTHKTVEEAPEEQLNKEDTITNDDLDLIEELSGESSEEVVEQPSGEIPEYEPQVDPQIESQEEVVSQDIENEVQPIQEEQEQEQVVEEVQTPSSITDQILQEDAERIAAEEAARPDPIEEQIEKPTNNEDKMETRAGATPIVPVYNAEIPDEDIADSDVLQQGDVVIHDEFGKGIVEKLINYGDRVLCSINFEAEGRKLLDPKISELKKM